MSSANLNISIVDKRMLKQSEAANYTGLPAKYFKSTCPVQPIELRPGNIVYDKRDLDNWIDQLKTGTDLTTHDAILSKI